MVGAIETPLADANRFGVIAVDEDRRILSFDEKPDKPMHIPGDPTQAFVSMGIGARGVDLVAVAEAVAVGVGDQRVGLGGVDLVAVDEAISVGVTVKRV